MAKPKPKVEIRKPPAPKPANVEAFVRDGSSSAPRRAAVMTRASGATVRRTVVYLPLDVARQVAVRCALEDVDVSAFVAEAVVRRLAEDA